MLFDKQIAFSSTKPQIDTLAEDHLPSIDGLINNHCKYQIEVTIHLVACSMLLFFLTGRERIINNQTFA